MNRCHIHDHVDMLRYCAQRMAHYSATAIDHGLIRGDQLPLIKVGHDIIYY